MKKSLFINLFFAVLSNSLTAQIIDTSFGVNGSLTQNDIGNLYGPRIADNGRFFFPGVFFTDDGSNAVLYKYNPDGTLDNGFGVGGKFEVNNYPADHDEVFFGVTILPDGKILMLYSYESNPGVEPEVAGTKIIRLNPNGTVDESFVSTVDNYEFNDYIVLQNGKILCVTSNSFTRILPDGALDLSYSDNGVRNLTFNNNGAINNDYGIFLINNDDNQLVKMTNEESQSFTSYSFGEQINCTRMENNHFYVNSYNQITKKTKITKLDSNLALIPSFGVNGVYNEIEESTFDWIVAIQENGSILSSGIKYDPDTELNYSVMKRISPNGTIDSTFGDQGIFTYPLQTQYDDWFYHPNLKKLYLWMENTEDPNDALVKRFTVPAEILSVVNFTQKIKPIILENPVKSILKLSENIKNAEIYTASGNHTGISFSGSQFPVNKLSPGLYITTGTSADGKKISLKFIKE